MDNQLGSRINACTAMHLIYLYSWYSSAIVNKRTVFTFIFSVERADVMYSPAPYLRTSTIWTSWQQIVFTIDLNFLDISALSTTDGELFHTLKLYTVYSPGRQFLHICKILSWENVWKHQYKPILFGLQFRRKLLFYQVVVEGSLFVWYFWYQNLS